MRSFFLLLLLFLAVVFLFYKVIDLRKLSLEEWADQDTEDAAGYKIEQGGLPVIEDKHNHYGSYDGDQVTDDNWHVVVFRGLICDFRDILD